MRGANGALRPSPLCTNLVRLPFTALGRPFGGSWAALLCPGALPPGLPALSALAPEAPHLKEFATSSTPPQGSLLDI